MLFHTWPFLIFALIVLPVFYALRKTPLWIPWLMAASYFFYGWWNPYYLLLVVYSTTLDYLLVTLMDHCPLAGPAGSPGGSRSGRGLRFPWSRGADPVLRAAFFGSTALALGLIGGAWAGPATLRPTCLVFSALVLLMAAGAWSASRRI